MRNLGGELSKVAKRGAVLGGLGGVFFKTQLLDTASEFENLRVQLESLEGSSEAGKKAMSWIMDFSTQTPMTIEGTAKAFAKMRAFGMNPMGGQMKSLVDQTSKLGFSQEKLEGIVTALGQAWTKQKLQGEEIMQLQERSVPVWDILSKAMGRSVPALQKMSSAGKLGRKEISLLIDTMGAMSDGASVRAMDTYSGLVSNLGVTWTKFKLSVMQGGLFDFIKNGLRSVSARLELLTKSGELDAWAARVSEAFKSIFKSGKEFARWVRGSLIPNVQQLVHGLGGWKNALIAVAVAMNASAIVAVGQLVIALGGLLLSVTGTTAALVLRMLPALGANAATMALLNTNVSVLAAGMWARIIPALKVGTVALWGMLKPAALAAAPFLAVAAAIAAVSLAIQQLVKHWDALNFGEVLDGIKMSVGEQGLWKTWTDATDMDGLFQSLGKDLGLIDSPRINAASANAGAPAKAANAELVVKLAPGLLPGGAPESSGPIDFYVDSGHAAVGAM
jgi:tape measure domain-containing protein